MPSTNDHNAPSSERCLWLEVHHDGRAHVFCCAVNEERAIVLGSLPRADIRVAGRGIAPVHFHFEREGDRVILVPTYNAEVRVNSMLVRGRVPIPEHAVVEFAGIRIEALVRSTPPERVDYPSLDIPDRESGISYLAALPTDTQTTKLALDAFRQGETDLQTTHVMERLQVVTAEIPASAEHTVRMERIAPETFRAPAVEPTPIIEVSGLRPVPIVPLTAAEPPPGPPPAEIPSSPAGLGWQETTAFDLDGLKADLAPTPVPQPRAPRQQGRSISREPVIPAQPRSAGEMSSPPRTRSVRPPPSRGFGRVVSRLGERAKVQPVAVATIALGAAVTLALLMVGVSRVVSRDPMTTARSQPLTDVTQLPIPKVPAADMSPASIAIARTPPWPPSTESRDGDPGFARAATAAAHLGAGRYLEARAAYAELSHAHPEIPAYQAMRRLLDRRTSAACVGASAAAACPEIVQ